MAERLEDWRAAESRLDALTKAAVCVANDLKQASTWRAQLNLTSESADLLAEKLRSAMVVENHTHNWVDPSNEAVEAGEWRLCVECGALKAPETE